MALFPSAANGLALLYLCAWLGVSVSAADTADLILHHGRIATVDNEFRIVDAIAVREGRILATGSDDAILLLRGDKTEVVDLEGKFAMPGLIDSHTHPTGASMYEFEHPIPDMETIEDVLKYIHSRTEAVPEGEWIRVNQVFITRLKEKRYPTREELDRVAPKHPVVFSTGPDASVNSLALSLSGIDKEFRVTGSGIIERDPKTQEPTGLLRGGTSRYLKSKSSPNKATHADQVERLAMLFADYNANGITAIADRNASESALTMFEELKRAGKLTVRVAASYAVNGSGAIADVRKKIAEVSQHRLRRPDPMLRVVGIKTFQDGGMLTGSAYMREPWGLSDIYSIRDPQYRGVLFIPKEDLLEVVRATVEQKLQFTAHSVGDGAVYNLVDVYEELSKSLPVRETRPCITHCNFMGPEAVARMARLGIVADIQPAWLYLDSRVLQDQFGYDRLRYFQPLKSLFAAGGIAGGGSDHMQKIGSLRSINPYNPFLGIWVAVSRRARHYEGQMHVEEALTREQALQFYTRNNAYLLFLDDQIGSLEKGKLADLIVLDRDLLQCPEEAMRDTRVLRTYMGGKLVYSAKEP